MIEKLYMEYQQELVHWATAMTQDQGMAEELVQEAFVRAMLHTDDLLAIQEPQQRAWLYRTTKNLYIDRVRHTASETIVMDIPENSSSNMSELAEIQEFEWQQLLEALPDMEGALFSMRYLQGYNSRQLGEIFQLPPGTVRSKLSSARTHLRQALSQKSGKN